MFTSKQGCSGAGFAPGCTFLTQPVLCPVSSLAPACTPHRTSSYGEKASVSPSHRQAAKEESGGTGICSKFAHARRAQKLGTPLVAEVSFFFCLLALFPSLLPIPLPPPSSSPSSPSSCFSSSLLK